MPALTIWLSIGVSVALLVVAGGLVALAMTTDIPIVAALLLLAVLDLVIIVGGYIAVRRSLSSFR